MIYLWEEGRSPRTEKCSSATLPGTNAAWIFVVLKIVLRGKITRINRRGPVVFGTVSESLKS